MSLAVQKVFDGGAWGDHCGASYDLQVTLGLVRLHSVAKNEVMHSRIQLLSMNWSVSHRRSPEMESQPCRFATSLPKGERSLQAVTGFVEALDQALHVHEVVSKL